MENNKEIRLILENKVIAYLKSSGSFIYSVSTFYDEFNDDEKVIVKEIFIELASNIDAWSHVYPNAPDLRNHFSKIAKLACLQLDFISGNQ